MFTNFFPQAPEEKSTILPPHTSEKMLGPKHYIIENSSDTFSMATFGCFGEKSIEQVEVADLLNEHDFQYALLLGDTVYGDNTHGEGLYSATDPRLKEQIDEVYLHPKRENLNNKMWLSLMGNHDQAITKKLYMARLALNNRLINAAKNMMPTSMQTSVDSHVNEFGEKRGKHEIDASLANMSPETRAAIESGRLDPKKHTGFILPHFYNDFEDGPVKLFAVDSNTILFYYYQHLLAWANNLPENPKNQFTFLKNAYDKTDGENVARILSQHHPIKTCGKERNEGKFYTHDLIRAKIDIITQLPKDEHYRAQVKRILSAATHKELRALSGSSKLPKLPQTSKHVENHGRLIQKMYRHEEMVWDLALGAHDHHLTYSNNIAKANAKYKYAQIVSGGGGAAKEGLQKRHSYKNQQYTGYFLKENGFNIISCKKNNPKLLTIDVYTTKKTITNKHDQERTIAGLHLRFTNQSIEPERDVKKIEDAKTVEEIIAAESAQKAEVLRTLILQACNAYLTEGTDSGPGLFSITSAFEHSEEQDDCAHYLWAYVNQYTPPSFENMLKTLREATKELSEKTVDSSLYQRLNTNLEARYSIGLANLYELNKHVSAFRI